ncbi:hypothetical protein P7C70_g2137, partial [Phenoliferia sp. Uapishka_3]
MGLGRYQRIIWLLCGFGYLLDLMWAQAFGLSGLQFCAVFDKVADALDTLSVASPNIFTAFSTGLTVGAFSWGLLVDIIGQYNESACLFDMLILPPGRKWAFNLTCLIASVFGLLLASPTNYNGICVLTALCGFGLGGNIPIDATIVIEFLPQNRRWLLPLLSIFQPLGVVVTAVIAFGLLPGIGRKWSLVVGALVQGVSMAMYTQVTTIKASVGLNALEYIMQSFFNAVLYGFTPEVFEAPYRGSAAGLCSTFGRLAGIIAPIAARPYIDGNSNGVLWLACGGIFLSAFFLVFLPIETRHRATY